MLLAVSHALHMNSYLHAAVVDAGNMWNKMQKTERKMTVTVQELNTVLFFIVTRV